MENIQINGQRIWGPPSNWLGPPPPHGTEIIVKNIPDDVLELELYNIFSSAGKVYEVRLPVHWSGINRGYAFIRFTKISEANAAIKNLDKFAIRSGRNIKVERSIDNTRLFLSAVPNQKTGEELKKILLTVVDNVKKVYVYPSMDNSSVFRGYAFAEFNCHRDAAIAKRILTPDVCLSLFQKKCIAAWANPLPFLNQDILETINILFMRNIPKDMKSVTIKKSVEMLISPDSIQKVKRINDFAFLTFKNHESANRAMNIIKNNKFLLGQNTEVQIEWAVPRELAAPPPLDMKENEKPEQSLSPKAHQSDLKPFQDSQTDKQMLMVQVLCNLSDPQNTPKDFKGFPKKEKREFGSSNYINRVPAKKTENVDTGLWKNGNNFGEFHARDSEEYFRNLYFKQWMENLVCPPCTPSPTSSSGDSHTDMSWKYHEEQNQYWMSYDGKMERIGQTQFAGMYM